MKKLTKSDFESVHWLVNSSDEATRKLAAKFLCDLAHANLLCQNRLCEVFGFTNFQGKVRFEDDGRW